MLSVGAVMPTLAHAGAARIASARAVVSNPIAGDDIVGANLSITGILEHMRNIVASALARPSLLPYLGAMPPISLVTSSPSAFA